jgi:hypothetical protein
MADLRGQEIKDRYQSILTTSETTSNPTTGTLQNGNGANITALTLGGTLNATKLVPTGNVTAGNGMYLPTTNTLALSTNGAERMRIDSAGNVGIGTSSPARILDVNGDAAIHGVRVGRGAGNIDTNTALGSGALNANTTGVSNTANGAGALEFNTTGDFNTVNGQAALRFNTTGTENTATGVNALRDNTTGTNNTANGVGALRDNTTGNDNTATGQNAGRGASPFTNANTTGSNNTFIGFQSAGASATASNVITLGNGSIATLRCQVTTITSLSDERDKKDIAPLSAGLDFLTKLRPVSFKWNTRDGAKVDVDDSGFIAQELLAVQEDTGITIPNLVSQENPDKLEAGYGTLIPVLVSAVQELTSMVKQLQNEIDTLKGDK